MNIVIAWFLTMVPNRAARVPRVIGRSIGMAFRMSWPRQTFYPLIFSMPLKPHGRGAPFSSTPGEGIQVSADSDNPTGTAPDFTNINPGYTFKPSARNDCFLL